MLNLAFPYMKVVDAYLTYLNNYVLRIRAFSYSMPNTDIHSNEYCCAIAQQTTDFCRRVSDCFAVIFSHSSWQLKVEIDKYVW